jgi:cbb3-type cytochrome oxidase cytochrome c subunit
LALGALAGVPALALQSEAVDFQEPLPRGERLLGEFHCSACHGVNAAMAPRLVPVEAPNLSALGGRVRSDHLRKFLAYPAKVHPRNRMPDLLAALSAEERDLAIGELVAFLLTLGEPAAEGTPGLLGELERGRQLFHRAGCVACHRPHEDLYDLDWTLQALLAREAGEEPETDAAPAGVLQILDDEVFLLPGTLPHPDRVIDPLWLAGKYEVTGLAAFLEDPLAVRPSGNMPDLGLSGEEAMALAKYLLRVQVMPLDEGQSAPGLRYEYFEARLDKGHPDWPGVSPVATGSTPDFDIGVRTRNDDFGLRFSGTLEIPEAGHWSFALTSDDGSWLELDGRMVVDNGGVHGSQRRTAGVDLEAGAHSIRVSMFEHGGGEKLEVAWQAPGAEFTPIPSDALSHISLLYPGAVRPADASPDSVAAGRERFVALGCVACHVTGLTEVDLRREEFTAGLPALADLDPSRPSGCLTPTTDGGPTRIVFSEPSDRAAVLETLESLGDLCEPLSSTDAVARRLQRLNCYACHRRSGIGGPHPDAAEFFVGDENAELGDEGRFPPPLTGVGSKLTESWLREVLLEDLNASPSRSRVRPYLETRMPHFGEGNVGDLVGLLRQADGAEAAGRAQPLASSPGLIMAGHKLAGTGGLGCIQCHPFGKVPSLGITSVNLFGMSEHLQFDWFRQLLLDPASTGMDSRMPDFWLEGESPVDVLGKDPALQIEALWAFLSQGENMMPPRGLNTPDAAYELIPDERPLCVGVFMKGVSPRTLAVGFPEWVHYAYDMQSARLASSWRGRFFNTRGTWQGRAGALESPPSVDTLDWPAGAALAPLVDLGDPWPATAWAFGGRRMDSQGRPTLLSSWKDVRLEEQPLPWEGGLARDLRLSAPRPVPDLVLRVFHWQEGGDGWVMPPPGKNGLRHFAAMDPPLQLRVEDARGTVTPTAVVGRGVELRVPVHWEKVGKGVRPWRARMRVEVIW